LVTSAAGLGTFLGAGVMTASAMASTNPATAARPDTSTNIDKGYEGESACAIAGWKYCLFYLQNFNGAVWGTNQKTIGTITGTFSDEYPDVAGAGDPVRNDAASMADNTDNCNVTTWVYPNYTGAFNWLEPMWDGNLTSSLRNNEASISYNNCS
jgi:hypothetical protein